MVSYSRYNIYIYIHPFAASFAIPSSASDSIFIFSPPPSLPSWYGGREVGVVVMINQWSPQRLLAKLIKCDVCIHYCSIAIILFNQSGSLPMLPCHWSILWMHMLTFIHDHLLVHNRQLLTLIVYIFLPPHLSSQQQYRHILRKQASLVNTAPDMAPPWERLSRRWKSLNTLNITALSAARLPSSESPLASGSAWDARRL